MRMKATLLTLLLALLAAVATKWSPARVSADTTVAVCGRISGFVPATATTNGAIKVDDASYVIAAGTTIGGQPAIRSGATMCLDLTLNGSNQIIPPTRVAGASISVCGTLNSYKAAVLERAGAISIGSSDFVIAPGASLSNDSMAVAGSSVCLTGAVNAAGQLIYPSALIVDQSYPIATCGPVTAYTAATSNSSGFLSIGGLSFTLAPGLTPAGSVNVGGSSCLLGTMGAQGQLVSPTSMAGYTTSGLKICGVVTAYRGAGGGADGSITIGGITLPIAEGVVISGQGAITVGSNICLSPCVLVNGKIAAGTAVGNGEGICLQFTTPAVTHGQINGEDEIFLLPKPIVFTASTTFPSASVFNINPANFGRFPALSNTAPQGITAMTPNTTIRALSCTDSFWDMVFEISTKGQTEGDMVTLFLQNPNGSGVQILAMFTIQNGGVVLNSVHPDITFLMNGNGPFGAGSFIPLMVPAGAGGVSTPQLTLVWSMNMSSPLNGCFQMGVDIKRVGGNGMTSFAPQYVVVKRMGNEAEGNGIYNGGNGTYPTGLICNSVCTGCFLQPTPTPSPTPTPTPPPMPIKCDTICFRSPSFYLLRLNYLPNGSILISGVNFNNPISIQRSKDQIRIALQGSGTGMLNLNREFVAMQISLAYAGGLGSPVVFNTYWSPLRCSGITFQPVTLSNGVTITPDSLIDTLFMQTQQAIRENRTADMGPLASIMALLNQRC